VPTRTSKINAAIRELVKQLYHPTPSIFRRPIMRSRVMVLAAALLVAPVGARAADLVVWWEKGYYAQEDEAMSEVIAAFEDKTGKRVQLVLQPQAELPDKLEAALEADRPPDFTFGLWLDTYIPNGLSRIGW
jgi:ABC-type glycerol-3-phosphate transport system substrate-binding protein